MESATDALTTAAAMLPRERPHGYLIPKNGAARGILEEPHNANYIVSREEGDYEDFVFYLDFRHEDRTQYVLGRGSDVDIQLPDSKADISKTQCVFRLDGDSGAVFLDDRSSHQSTETFASRHDYRTTIAMPSRSPRSVLVARDINNHIAIGRKQHYQFELFWLCDGLYDFPQNGSLQKGPINGNSMKYVQGEKIGGGAFGNVFKALDVHTGELIAVKKMHNLDGKNLEFANREIRHLNQIQSSEIYGHVSSSVQRYTRESAHSVPKLPCNR
jgi:hypothetical protein